MSGSPGLSLSGVSLQFGGVRALEDVSLEVEPGEILAVIGPNGAGKTSLINVVTGFYVPTAGTVSVAGSASVGLSPHKVARRGVSRTFQTPRLASELTCMGNLVPVFHAAGHRYAWGTGRRGFRAIEERCSDALRWTGLEGRELDRAETLSLGEQRRLELARACVAEPSVLLLDEVASGLAEVEAETIVPAIKRMARERQTAVVVVEHSMTFVRQTADRVVVLVKGRVVAQGGVEETLSDPTVVESYLGTVIDD